MRVHRGRVGLYVDVSGPDDGPAVLFLHGVTASGRVWDWLPAAVTAGRRVIKLDFRGHGRSDRAPGTYLLPTFADDVAAVLREVVGGPAAVVGHSLGGAVAWALAQREPDLVSAAFLEDPPLFPSGRAETPGSAFGAVFAAMRAATLRWQREGRSAEEIAEQVAANPFSPAQTVAAGLAPTRDAVWATGFNLKHLDTGVLDAVLDGTMLAGLDTAAPVTAPVFILAADAALGAAFTPDHGKQLAATHPAVEVLHLPGAGHRIHQEQRNRAAFTVYLATFLARHAD